MSLSVCSLGSWVWKKGGEAPFSLPLSLSLPILSPPLPLYRPWPPPSSWTRERSRGPLSTRRSYALSRAILSALLSVESSTTRSVSLRGYKVKQPMIQGSRMISGTVSVLPVRRFSCYPPPLPLLPLSLCTKMREGHCVAIARSRHGRHHEPERVPKISRMLNVVWSLCNPAPCALGGQFKVCACAVGGQFKVCVCRCVRVLVTMCKQQHVCALRARPAPCPAIAATIGSYYHTTAAFTYASDSETARANIMLKQV